MEGAGKEVAIHDEVICARMVRHTVSLVSIALSQPSDLLEIKRLCAVAPSTPISALSANQVGDFVSTFHRQAVRVQELISVIEAARLNGAYIRSTVGELIKLEQALREIEDATRLKQIQRSIQAVTRFLNQIRDAANSLLQAAPISEEPLVQERVQDEARREGAITSSRGPETDVKFTLLLVTDLHWRCGKSETRWRDVQQPLLDCLKGCLGSDQHLDLVICAGDLAFSGKLDELKSGVDPLLKTFWEMFMDLGFQPPFLMVPGNHDLQWPSDSNQKKLAKQMLRCSTDSKFRENIWSNHGSPEVALISQAANDWSVWQRDNLNWQFSHDKLVKDSLNHGLLPGDFSYRFRKRGCTLGIVGLNTTFLQLDSSDYEGKLALDSSQLHQCCPPDGRNWLSRNDANLLLTHHPPGWLHPSVQAHFWNDICIAGLMDLHLHGHLHAAGYAALGHQPNQLVHRIQGISLFGEEHFFDHKKKEQIKRLHGFVLIEFSVAPEVLRFRFRPIEFTDDKRPVPPHEIQVGEDGWTAWQNIPKKRKSLA